MITGINTFRGNKSCYEAVTSCQIKDVLTFFQLFPKKLSKGGTKFVQAFESSCMWRFCARIVRFELFDYAVDRGSGKSPLLRGIPSR